MTADATTALVLAGKRDGALDPLAEGAGVTHKCLVPVAGRPLLAHVVEALAASPLIGRVVVSIDDPAVIAREPSLAGLETLPAEPALADSVLAAVAAVGTPLLITTADNVLLTPATIAELTSAVSDGHADAAVAVARRESVLAAHPTGQRKFYEFRDGGYSNCNLYWLGTARGVKAVETFRGGGQFVKHPKRIVEAFGLLNLLRFRSGLFSLEAILRHVSRRFGATIRPVVLKDGSQAIDVDNARTRGIAETLLDARRAAFRSDEHAPTAT